MKGMSYRLAATEGRVGTVIIALIAHAGDWEFTFPLV